MHAAPSEERPLLVAAFGHAWLKDQSFGLHVLRRLAELELDRVAELADWTFGTITAVQKMMGRGYRSAVFLSGTARGRTAGELYCFRPSETLPPPEEIHARIGDCVMGCVSVDNLVIIGRYYDELPPNVLLVEAEPVDETWGKDLSPALSRLVEPAVAAVLEEVKRAGY